MESQHGKELVRGAIYEFHKPDPGQRMHVEVVFMHGLQVKAAELKDAYYKTWRTADGNEVWPETWLKDKYPNARILSLAYDSSARKTRAAGNMSPYLLGENLLDQMVSTAANIGQNDCPVVFVGHSLGGLIAKEIVVRCRNSDRANVKYQNLLRNLKAVFFYATPHGGSELADSWISKIADWFPFVEKSVLVAYLKPKGTDRMNTHHDFLQAVNRDCKFYVVAEGRKTEIPVIEEYRKRITVHLSVKPIGFEGKIDKISKRLEIPEVLMVFLFGMGGVGKTTLSKAFYNFNAFKYEKSCYLENVKSKGVEDVQKKLLRGLCGEKLGEGEGVETWHLAMIQDCLLEKKVLVVIDDVSSVDCLRELQVFHALETGSQINQSKVVVTGRDSAILPKKYLESGKAVIELVDGITQGSDLELFLLYAFEVIDPDDKEEANNVLLGEARRIVELCNGLPLSLEVLGKYLGNSRDIGEDLQQWKKTWAEAYDRLRKAQSIDGSMCDKLWSSLRISYDHLGDLEQQMFLDFACIFLETGARKRLNERIWDSPIGVKNLINKSLLKVEGGFFVMHDQLRDMARYMLLKEALRKDQHPIYLLQGYGDHSETYMEFKKLTESGVPYIASLEQEVKTNLHQYSKLRFFHMSEGDTPSLVDDCLSQCSGDFRWLHLAYSRVTKIGIRNLCSLEGLRVLQIWDCEDIVKLPEAFGNLTNLVELEVRECSNLQSLPNSIGKLKKLKRLEIRQCGLRVVPDSVGQLSEVEFLSFGGCYHLTVIRGSQICTQKLVDLRLPVMPTDCRRPFPELQRLSISNYDEGLTEFPEDFFKMDMPKLEVLEWRNYIDVEVLLKNPDGSQLVLKKRFLGGNRFEVRRHSNGSILQLKDPLHNFL